MWSPPGQSATLHDIVKDGAWLVQAALCSERDVQARDGRRRRGESQRSEQLHGDPTSASRAPSPSEGRDPSSGEQGGGART